MSRAEPFPLPPASHVLLDTDGTPLALRTPVVRVVAFETAPGSVPVEAIPVHRLLIPVLGPGERIAGTDRRHGARHPMVLEAGDVLEVPAGVAAGLEWKDPMRGVAVHVDPDRLMAFAATSAPVAPDEDLAARLAAGPAVMRDPELAEAAIRLAGALREEGTGRDALGAALSTALLVVLLRHNGRPVAEAGAERLFPAVATLVEKRMHAHLEVSDMARAAAMSRSAFARRFGAATGMTPAAYLRRARVERARDLLAVGERPAEVAARCGFADQAHLTRVFKAATGETPAAWRARASA